MSRTIALIGNPNCGKTTLFNVLVGAKQQVGNWPGVTVERKSGVFNVKTTRFEIIDLPGIYTLAIPQAGSSKDEQLANQFIQAKNYDVIINVVDAINLERNLYLTTQLLELNHPMIVVINRMDLALKQGIKMDTDALAAELGCPVLPLIARDKVGVNTLQERLTQTLITPPNPAIAYPESIQAQIESIQALQPEASRFKCLNWLEGSEAPAEIASRIHSLKTDIVIASARYRWIENIVPKLKQKNTCRKIIKRASKPHALDKFLCHRYLGFPIFLAVMYMLFFFAINIGGVFQDFVEESTLALFVDGTANLLSSMHAPHWLHVLLVSGFGQGLSTVLTFVPIIGAMYFALAFLEDTGYLARAAFVVDRLMQVIGLPGKAFVPMIIGFGCNVPAIMGMRILENKRDRILGVMMSPFMSCGARLAIFTVLVGAFYPDGGANIIFLLYMIGIGMAILTGLLLKFTLLKGQNAPFVLEMPPFQWPHWHSLRMHAWQRLKKFILNAGKLILPVCVFISFINHLSIDGDWQTRPNERSVLSQVGQMMVPVFAPMGIEQENWPAAVGLLSGVLAKEVVVGTLNSLYSQQNTVTVDNRSLKTKLYAALETIPNNIAELTVAWRNPVLAQAPIEVVPTHMYGEMVSRFNGQASAFAYLLFVLLYFPCISATAAMVREVHRGWTLFSLCWTTGIAYVTAVTFYQSATFFNHPWQSMGWIGSLGCVILFTVMGLKHVSRQKFPKLLPTPVRLSTV